MFEPVWRQVVQGDYRAQPAWLENYARFAVAGETYPGIVRQAGGRVDGIVYFDVSLQDLVQLDAFEGSDYQRSPVCLQLQHAAPDAAPVGAETYLYTRPTELTATLWTPETFDLRQFMHRYC